MDLALFLSTTLPVLFLQNCLISQVEMEMLLEALIFDGTYLYGMTANGGANSDGVIFKILPDGTSYNKLLDFSGAANGQNPFGSLVSALEASL